MTLLPAAFSLTMSLLVLASIWSWMFVLRKLIAREPLLAYEPRKAARWSLLEVVITFMMIISLQALVGVMLLVLDSASPNVAPVVAAGAEQSPVTDSILLRWTIVLSGVASLVACGLGGLIIVMRTGSRWGTDLGLTLRQAGRDISYGVVAYALLAPIIMLIQATLHHWYPSEHPLIESFRSDPTLGFYLVCVFSAAIVAPASEEFVCRVLLQGWLERVFAATSCQRTPFLAQEQEMPRPERSLDVDSNPYAMPPGMSEVEADEKVSSNVQPVEPARPFPSVFPIIISSSVFAVLHWGNGLDPIPLFVLALGLGYLYQRTHRILPCVVLHFLVNAFALVMLAMSLVVK
ncbi:MAG: CPBP family intramembrane metalloprotease [Pirellulaceae bacterium]|jgi:membrane protease YdiL (CAAX protease family)|nr:CPBP family intramembrane metalloprotease [Pirellulaceae bacterium]HJN12846.1 CPBP family intramembrane glutamic endopeptidase [Pirellulaceae bacterium]